MFLSVSKKNVLFGVIQSIAIKTKMEARIAKSEDGRNWLVQFLMDNIGVDLDGLKKKGVKQFSVI